MFLLTLNLMLLQTEQTQIRQLLQELPDLGLLFWSALSTYGNMIYLILH